MTGILDYPIIDVFRTKIKNFKKYPHFWVTVAVKFFWTITIELPVPENPIIDIRLTILRAITR